MCCNTAAKEEKYIYSLEMKFMAGKRKWKAHMFCNYLPSFPKAVSNETARGQTHSEGNFPKNPALAMSTHFTLPAISPIAKHSGSLQEKYLVL